MTPSITCPAANEVFKFQATVVAAYTARRTEMPLPEPSASTFIEFNTNVIGVVIYLTVKNENILCLILLQLISDGT